MKINYILFGNIHLIYLILLNSYLFSIILYTQIGIAHEDCLIEIVAIRLHLLISHYLYCYQLVNSSPTVPFDSFLFDHNLLAFLRADNMYFSDASVEGVTRFLIRLNDLGLKSSYFSAR